MKTGSAFFLAGMVLLATAMGLHARTWTDAASGRTLEGDYVESDGTQVVIKSGDRTLKIDIARLSDADKAFIKEQAAKPAGAGASADGDPLTRLTPPASVKVDPISGEGDDRESKIHFKNESGKEITLFTVDTLFLEADGSVGKSVPHTHNGEVGKGKTHIVDVSSFFMEDDTASLGARIGEIRYEDGTFWPPAPDAPPARNGEDPVAAVVTGIVGEGDRSEPVTALHNYDAKDIQSVSYRIEYLDGDGEILDTTSYGYAGGDDPVLPSGETIVLSGGDGPPEGAKDAKARATRITFADKSEWKAPQ